MLRKLTLTIDQAVIEKAKAFARHRNKSVSRIVEEYLRTISGSTAVLPFSNTIDSPVTDSLVGMFEDSGKEYSIMLEEALLEKHL